MQSTAHMHTCTHSNIYTQCTSALSPHTNTYTHWYMCLHAQTCLHQPRQAPGSVSYLSGRRLPDVCDLCLDCKDTATRRGLPPSLQSVQSGAQSAITSLCWRWQESGWGCMLQGTPRSPGGGAGRSRALGLLRSCQEPGSTLPFPQRDPEIDFFKKWLKSTGSPTSAPSDSALRPGRADVQAAAGWEANPTGSTRWGVGDPVSPGQACRSALAGRWRGKGGQFLEGLEADFF